MEGSLIVDFWKHQDGQSLLLSGTLLAAVYMTTLVLYRFFFHPLAKIPGPPLAIATYVYQWYYDIWHQGTYTFLLQQLHEQYGPVIRLNPDEVHIFDHEYFEEVWGSNNGRVDKPENHAGKFGPYPSVIGTSGHDLHRLRRSAISAFFSRTAVLDLIPAIMRPLNLLCDRLQDASRTGETLNMKYFFQAVTLDVINDYCFARDPVHVSKSDFNRQGFDDVEVFLTAGFLNINFPWLLRPMVHLPDWLTKIISTALTSTLELRYDLSRQIEAIRTDDDQSYKTATHRTIFHELLSSDKLPPNELAKDRVRDEAFSLITAGSGTTSLVLRGTAYHISANPDIRKRLFNELKTAIPDPKHLPPLPELEKLEYLSAVIQEGLRLHDPVSHRLGRAFPDKTLVHPSGLSIPPGTTVLTTLWLTMHRNAEIYPEPQTFRPERWLGPEGKKLEKYLVSFSRGPRSCLGQNLGRAELVLCLAAVYRRFDFDVSAIDRVRDVDTTRDVLIASQAKDSPGLLVKVKAVD